jgi:hypothetical protein
MIPLVDQVGAGGQGRSPKWERRQGSSTQISEGDMAIEITEEQRHSDLKEEYFFLQGQYEDYDKRSLQIKGWVSAGALTALALGFQAESKIAALVFRAVSFRL